MTEENGDTVGKEGEAAEPAPRILERGVGMFEGNEEMPPAPWAPDGLRAVGRTEARLVHGGRTLVSDYVQRVDGEVTLEAHTVVRALEGGRFTMHFFPSDGGEPTVMEGSGEGDALHFEGEGPGGLIRQTFRYRDDGLDVRSAVPGPDDGEWLTVFEGCYDRRAPG